MSSPRAEHSASCRSPGRAERNASVARRAQKSSSLRPTPPVSAWPSQTASPRPATSPSVWKRGWRSSSSPAPASQPRRSPCAGIYMASATTSSRSWPRKPRKVARCRRRCTETSSSGCTRRSTPPTKKRSELQVELLTARERREIDDALESHLAQLTGNPPARVLDELHAVQAIPRAAADVPADQQEAARLVASLPGLQHRRENHAARGRLLRQSELACEQRVAVLKDHRACGKGAAEVLDVDLDGLTNRGRRREGQMGEGADAVIPSLARFRLRAASGEVGASGEDRRPQRQDRRRDSQHHQHLLRAHRLLIVTSLHRRTGAPDALVIAPESGQGDGA